MNEYITSNILLRAVIPFGAASIFFVVLVYFSIVRHRIGGAYFYYAAFIICFIAFLLGPLVNLSVIDIGKRWYDIFRNVLLFSIGLPSLLIGLLCQAKIKLSIWFFIYPVSLGVAWSILFILSPPLYLYNAGEIPWLLNLNWLKYQHIYYSQIVLIVISLVIPCLFILAKKPTFHVAMHVYGTLALCFFMSIGNFWQLWELYYAGSSLTALIWGAAVCHDIQKVNEQIKQQNKHQKLLAKAQFLASGKENFVQYYPETLSEEYPFKEREILLESIRTASKGVLNKQANILFIALEKFTQSELKLYQLRSKEILFMAFDCIVFQHANKEVLLTQLDHSGQQIEQADSIGEVNKVMFAELKFLCELPRKAIDKEINQALVSNIKTYILSHYHKNISINDIVDNIGGSRSHLMKAFKVATQQTINQYLVDVRINKAKILLLSMKVTDVAFEVGFNDSAYFSTVFKKQVGMSPKDFQAKAKGG